MRFVLSLLLGTVVAACSGSPAQPGTDRSEQFAVPGSEFQLRTGATAVLSGQALRITFEAVTEDSRCPAGAECVWEGNARVQLIVAARGGPSRSVGLNTTLEPRQTDISGFTLRLVKLDPVPVLDAPLRQAQYVATLMVTQAG